MRTLPARVTISLCLVSLVACTTVRPGVEGGAAPVSAQQVQTSVKPGDSVALTQVDGSVLKMNVVSVIPDALEGSLAGSSAVTRVQIDQIRKIQRREVDGVKIAALGLGIVAIIGLALQSLTHLYD